MESLNLPSYKQQLRKRKDKKIEIFDIIRKKYVILTPEEWVRQHFTNFLIYHRKYPQGLIGNEITLQLNGSNRRCDTVIFSKNSSNPKVIIEYKAPYIPITQETFNQITSYNTQIHAEYIFVSNGLKHYACKINYDTLSIHFLQNIPFYNEL